MEQTFETIIIGEFDGLKQRGCGSDGSPQQQTVNLCAQAMLRRRISSNKRQRFRV
jgi:hypothetical protein